MFKGDMGNLMKKAQQIQEKMQQAQSEAANIEVEGEAGAGLVRVTMTGQHDLRRVKIDPSLKEEALEILEDLVAAAVNDAVRKVEKERQKKMEEISGGLGPLADMKMPF